MIESFEEDSFSRDDERFWGLLGDYALQATGIRSARETHFIRTPDDRRLAVDISGHHDGEPVMLLHGSPGSRTGPKLSSPMLHLMGIKLITYDRPGYGFSDPQPGRRVVDAVSDARTILDYLQLDRPVNVVGRSGGGPRALAIAHGLPDRIAKVATLSSLAPREYMGEAWYEGMGPGNIEKFKAAEASPEMLVENIEGLVKETYDDPDVLIEALKMEFSVDDHYIVYGSNQMRFDLTDSYKMGLRAGAAGWRDDILGNVKPWGFDPREITVPTLVWNGGDDAFVPPGHGAWLGKNIPGAVHELMTEAGHFRAMKALPSVISWFRTGRYVYIDGDRRI